VGEEKKESIENEKCHLEEQGVSLGQGLLDGLTLVRNVGRGGDSTLGERRLKFGI